MHHPQACTTILDQAMVAPAPKFLTVPGFPAKIYIFLIHICNFYPKYLKISQNGTWIDKSIRIHPVVLLNSVII
jgi:hypothetical protein